MLYPDGHPVLISKWSEKIYIFGEKVCYLSSLLDGKIGEINV
jgi:hypothetical protein